LTLRHNLEPAGQQLGRTTSLPVEVLDHGGPLSDRLGFWERNGYNNAADPGKEER